MGLILGYRPDWFEAEYGTVLPEMLILVVLALIISLIGFYCVVYFISIGYAFSIVAMAVVSPVRHFENLAWTSAIQNILLVLWGVRLGVYLVQREYRASYRKELADIHQRTAGMSWITKMLIWARLPFGWETGQWESFYTILPCNGLPVQWDWCVSC